MNLIERQQFVVPMSDLRKAKSPYKHITVMTNLEVIMITRL